jgi:hypothetical protein
MLPKKYVRITHDVAGNRSKYHPKRGLGSLTTNHLLSSD